MNRAATAQIATERAVRRAALRLEAAAGADVEAGADLARFLLGGAVVARALAAGLVEWHNGKALLTERGLALLADVRAARAAKLAEQELRRAAELEERERAAAAKYEAGMRRARAQGLLDWLRGLRDELVETLDALDALDACAVAPAGRCGAPAAATLAPALASCAPAPWKGGRRLAHCDARWSARAIEPRRRAVLFLLPGGISEHKPTPAQVKARRECENARAQGIPRRAAKRWARMHMPLLAGALPVAGTDLRLQLDGARAHRRHVRPLFALGLVRHDVTGGACVSQKTRVLLTAAGAAWLAEQVRRGDGGQAAGMVREAA